MLNSSFFKNTIIYGVGNVSVLIINFILVPLYTFYLNKNDLGYYDIIVTTAAFLLPFVTLQMEMAILRWLLNESDSQIKQKVIHNSLLALLLSLALFSILFIVVSFFVSIANFALIFLFFILYFTYPFLKQIIRGIGNSKQYVITEILYTVLYLLFALLFVGYLKFQVRGLIIANVTALFFVIAFIVYNNKLYLYLTNFCFSVSILKEMLIYSIPLVLNTTSVWFMTFSIKYFIVYNLGFEGNGLYSVAFKFASIIQIVNTVFYLSWQEEAIKIYPIKELRSRFTSIIKGYTYFLLSLLLIIIGLQSYLIPFVIDKQYYSVVEYIPIISLGFVLMCLGSFYGIIYQCEKKMRGVSYSALLSSLLIVLINFISSSYYSLYVASLSFLIGFCIFFVYRMIDTRKFIQIRFPYVPFLSITILAFVINFYILIERGAFSKVLMIFLLVLALILNFKNIILVKELIFKPK